MKRKTHYLQSNKVAYYLLIAVFVMLSNSVFSQGAAVNTTGASADPSAVFDASSNTQGLLIPRMTTAERNAIVNPAEGLQIYNLDCHNFEYFNGTLWVAINPIIASVSISATPAGAVCTGTSVIFTASPVNGGTSPSYQWKLNGADVGTNSNTYTNSSLNNGDQISCELTSNANCVGGNPAFSNVLTMLIAQPPTAADAGTDQSLCNVTTATLSANTPSVGIGYWSVVSGTATILNPSSPTSGVTGLSLPGTATLLWTISNSPCSASADDVIITTNSCSTCGSFSVSFTYNSSPVTYGTVNGDYNGGQYCWLDRNLGASDVATAVSHVSSYGDYFQWGRLDDGHQVKTSTTTSTQSSLPNPGHNKFITGSSNWYSGPNPDNLWQGVSGINNPCPVGWRLPTEIELDNERLSWSSNDQNGAIQSSLRLPSGGWRSSSSGVVTFDGGSSGHYCNSTINGATVGFLTFQSSSASLTSGSRANGRSVRCLKD